MSSRASENSPSSMPSPTYLKSSECWFIQLLNCHIFLNSTHPWINSAYFPNSKHILNWRDLKKVKFSRLLIEEIWYVCHNVTFSKLQNGFLYLEVIYSNLKLQLITKSFEILNYEDWKLLNFGCLKLAVFRTRFIIIDHWEPLELEVPRTKF